MKKLAILCALLACALGAGGQEVKPSKRVSSYSDLRMVNGVVVDSISGDPMPSVDVIRLQDEGTTLATRAGGLLVFNCVGAGIACTWSGSTFTLTVGGGAAGATTALDNLAAVAINTSLISDTDNTDDLGSSSKQWRTGYFGTSLISLLFKSKAADPADAGAIQLGNNEKIGWEANPTGTDCSLTVNTSNQFVVDCPLIGSGSASYLEFPSDAVNTTSAANTGRIGYRDDTSRLWMSLDGAAVTTVVGPATTDTFTNKTLDVEGNGNVVTLVNLIQMDAATCVAATAALNWDDDPTLTEPAAACISATSTTYGVADFDAATDEGFQTKFYLPADWSGAIDLDIIWQAAATSGDVVWAVQTGCVADGEVFSVSMNAVDNFTADTAKGTANQANVASKTGITTTGCAAGELLFLRFLRNGDDAGDTMTGDARLVTVRVKMRRAQ